MKATDYIMNSSQIQSLNKAITVMRHFVDLSSKLLPFLQELNDSESLEFEDVLDRKKIIAVYKQNKFDIKTSEMLMDSDILELIHNAYHKLEKQEDAEVELAKFRMEHDRLKRNWAQIDAN